MGVSGSAGVDVDAAGGGQWVHSEPVRGAGAESDGVRGDHGGQEAAEATVHAAAVAGLRTGRELECVWRRAVRHRDGDEQARGPEGLRGAAGVRE